MTIAARAPTITQMDREAAADRQRFHAGGPSGAERAMRAGGLDHNDLVQRFAQHREAVVAKIVKRLREEEASVRLEAAAKSMPTAVWWTLKFIADEIESEDLS